MRIEVTNLDLPELSLYRDLNENQLRRYFEPVKEGLFIAESAKVVSRALDAGYEPYSVLCEQERLEKEEVKTVLERLETNSDLPIYTAPTDVLQTLTGFHLTGGLLCAFRRKPLLSVDEIVKKATRVAVLEGTVNPTNIGAIFRSAAALSMDAVLLSPGSSDPLTRRAGRVSMGTVFQVPWTFFPKDSWPFEALKGMKYRGFQVLAMALRDDAVTLEEAAASLRPTDRVAILLGTEGDGLTEEALARADQTVIIPMDHEVDSLNVAASAAVTFYALRKR